MSVQYLIGIDIGTTSTKGILVESGGRVVASHTVTHGIDSPQPGWYEHDADAVWWGDLCAVTRAVLGASGVDPRAVAGVAVSAMVPQMLPLDEQGAPLRKAILYSDARAQPEIAAMVAAYRRCHDGPISQRMWSTHYTGAKIAWFQKHEPQLWARTATIHSTISYMVYRLTAHHAISHAEAGGYAPLFDAGRRCWDECVCAQCGVPLRLLPEPVDSTAVVGGVTAAAARETGLAEGTPVIAGASDAAGELLSTGAVRPGEATLRYGTTMGISVIVPADGPTVHPDLMSRSEVLPGVHRLSTSMIASGALTTWFRDQFGQPEVEAERRLGLSAYALLAAAAEQVPAGSEGLLALPYFAGERAPIMDALARGMVLGLTLSHTRLHVYRALLEGIAYGLRQTVDELAERGLTLERIVGTGNGVRNRLWAQIVSDVLGREQELAIDLLGSPYGDAFLAGYGVGLFNDTTPLREGWAPATRLVRHDPSAHATYDRYYPVYRELYGRNREAMHALATLSSRPEAGRAP